MAMMVEMNGLVVNEICYDGEKVMVSVMGQKQVLEGEDVDVFKLQVMIYLELVYDNKGYEFKLIGVEKVDGELVYKIEIISFDGSKSIEYFVIESGLKLKVVRVQDGFQGLVIVINCFSDYQEVEGMMVLFQIEVEGMVFVFLMMKVQEV